MNLYVISDDIKIREIEDVIELQKASGNINAHQVSFLLPSHNESTVSANGTRSLDSGLLKSKSELKNRTKKLQKKITSCRTLLPDIISWPSDSDITVLRMKLCLNNTLKEKITVPGDGLHQPNSSSMVNLATMIHQSPQPSKHSILEEMLYPLTSWQESELDTKTETFKSPESSYQRTIFSAACNRFDRNKFSKNSDYTDLDTKSKIARFFRLYFCPCCSCLYNMEKLRDDL